jgi:uncharacterized membrane protein YfcA
VGIERKEETMIFHSSFEYIYLWLPLLGFVVGFFGSFTGGGGGFVFIPLLTLLFGVEAHVAIGSSLAATLPICLAGAYGHYKKKNLDIRMGLVFAAGGILGAITGASLTRLLTGHQLRVCFGVYSILIALTMYIGQRKDRKRENNGDGPRTFTPAGKYARGSGFGILSGMITAGFGTSGSAPILAGLMSLRMPLKLVLGTSLFVVFFNTCSALGAHLLVGKVDLTLVLFLACGSIIGALLGPRFLARLKVDKAEGQVRVWYATVMVVSGILMIVL